MYRPQRSNRTIDETETIAANDEVRRVVLCSGKVYFDLLKARAVSGDKRVALRSCSRHYA